MKDLFIFGCGNYSRIAYNYIRCDKAVNTAFFVETNPKDKTYFDRKIIPYSELNTVCRDTYFYVAIFYDNLNQTRAEIFENIYRMGFRPYSLIHSSSIVFDCATIGVHCTFFEQVVIQNDVVIGDNVIIYSNSSISHDSNIGDNVFIGQNVAICGDVNIGKNSFIGAGVVIQNGVTIGENCVVGAGAVVKSDLPPNTLIKPPTCSRYADALQLFNKWNGRKIRV